MSDFRESPKRDACIQALIKSMKADRFYSANAAEKLVDFTNTTVRTSLQLMLTSGIVFERQVQKSKNNWISEFCLADEEEVERFMRPATAVNVRRDDLVAAFFGSAV